MFGRFNITKMNCQTFLKLQNNAEMAETKLRNLREKLDDIKKIKIEEMIKKLLQENVFLKDKIEKVKSELIRVESLNGKVQYPVPNKMINCVSSPSVEIHNMKEDVNNKQHSEPKKSKKEDISSKSKENMKSTPKSDSVVDIRKLDFRIGKIIDINKHPDADSLYVEKIDCGEENPRTVVSGLVNFVPIDEMKNRIVMVLCNLKPVKMRGVISEAMVMCASSPNKVEVLIPPSGSVPGDLVICDGYPREPEVQLNPKKKIFETCAPDLKTNDEKIACFKDKPLIVKGKGPVMAATLKGVSVK